jgi:hypothetical protein
VSARLCEAQYLIPSFEPSRALAFPEIGVKWSQFLFSGLGTVLRHISVFSPPVCLDVPDGLNVASTAYGKNYFHPALMEPRDLPSFNAVKITRQTSPNQALIDKRRSARVGKPQSASDSPIIPCHSASLLGHRSLCEYLNKCLHEC